MLMNEREKAHLENALYFTAIRGSNPRTRIRKEFAAYEDALAWARGYGDGRTMIYAVIATGSAHIANA